METVALAAKLADLKNFKTLLKQENFQNYKIFKMVYNMQIQSSPFGLCTLCNKYMKH